MNVPRLLVLACLALSLGAFGGPPKRAIRFTDITPPIREMLGERGLVADKFDQYISSLDLRTAERETEGEHDHLIYFALQSARFTVRPRIEPALSAYQFVSGLSTEERSLYLADHTYLPPIRKLPESAASRLADFIKAVERETDDERLSYFRRLLHQSKRSSTSSFEYIYAHYARAMRFLYQKEFSSKQITEPKDALAFIASLYQNRGHSTDTQIEANFTIHLMLASLKHESPSARLDNVLIIGPGLDFAPRTDLIDLFSPQSYQPFAVADALIGLKLSDATRLRLHCVDINDRVIQYFTDFPGRGTRQLAILSGVADTDIHPLSSEYKSYFSNLGKSIGLESQLGDLPQGYERRLKKSVIVSKEAAGLVTADKLNIITQRYDPSPGYDLVVVTNVLQYFEPAELLLALTNIQSMMKRGGYLIHNEPRQIMFSFAKAAGLNMLQSRTVLIAESKETPLYDGAWLHRK